MIDNLFSAIETYITIGKQPFVASPEKESKDSWNTKLVLSNVFLHICECCIYF